MTKLQQIRESQEISRYRLAQLTGFSITYISNLEEGRKSIEDIKLSNIRKFADALKVNFLDLID